jgi:hypothetical protein
MSVPIDLNDVPVTISDQLKEVREFLADVPKQDWWTPKDDVNPTADMLNHLEGLVEQLEGKGLELETDSSQFMAFSIGALFATLQCRFWNFQTTESQLQRQRVTRGRWDKHRALMEEVLYVADEEWKEGSKLLHNKMAEHLASKYNNHFKREIADGMTKHLEKNTIMKNPKFKALAARHGKLYGIKKS